VPPLRYGLTIPFPAVSLADHPDLVRRAEAAGYDDLWTGETNGPDGFTPLALAAAVTSTMRLGTGIVNPYTRGIPVLAQHAAALADASGGRFVLGLGSSSNVIVERWNGVPFVKPLSKVREAVEALRPILAGDRGPGGFKLETKPAHEIPIVLAALRGKMLGLAAEVGDGAFTNWLPVSGARQVADAFGAADKELVCRFFCIPQPAEEATGLAKWMFAAYGTVPVYTEFFRWLGWADAIDPVAEAWHGGDRNGALELVSEELIREIFLFGSADEMKARMDEFAAGGITTFVLTPITTPDQLPGMIDALSRAS
jgi:probable F420-dependent oxidoreductase